MIPSHKQLMGGDASTSGIINKFNSADRVIPESRRADGTLRKERKVRPGFTPPEDVGKYKNAKVAAWEAKALPKGAVVGKPAASPVVVKPKKKKVVKEEIPDDWDAEEEPKVEVKEDVDPEKRVKSLNKKLRQAEALREKQAAGETLLPEQQEKVDSIPTMEAEITRLQTDDLAENTAKLGISDLKKELEELEAEQRALKGKHDT